MRILFSLVSFLLTLVGCNEQPGTTTFTLSSVHGVGINSSKDRIDGRNARFECLKSASGQCNYVVFTRRCTQVDSADSVTDTCTTRVLEQFTLLAGKVREFDDLPAGTTHCIDNAAKPVASSCRQG